MHKPFNGHVHLKVGYSGSMSLRRLKADDIQGFYEEVLNEANEAASQIASLSLSVVIVPRLWLILK